VHTRLVKKTLRWVRRVTLALLALVLVFVLYISIDGIPKYKPTTVDLKVEVTPERVARGKRYVTMLCAGCHLNPETNQLTGKLMSGAPPEFGVIYSRNITSHPEKGIGKWTDGQLAVLIRTGLKPDGQYVPPYMAKLPHLAQDDLEGIIAFLRSDDELVRAQDIDDKDVEPSFLTKFLSHVAFSPLPYPNEGIVAPSVSDKVAYGKYLVSALECFTCRSADFKKLNVMDPEKSAGYLAGGNRMIDFHGKASTRPTITMDEETGIGKWSESDFRRALKVGFRPDNSPIIGPMTKYAELEDAEVDALYAYLKTVPKISNRRPPNEFTPPQGLTGGEAVYYRYRCDSCHGENGIGFCDLRHATLKYPRDDLLKNFINNPSAVVPLSKMPSWEGIIKDSEADPLIAYVKTLQAK
jgi:cytochrome c2